MAYRVVFRDTYKPDNWDISGARYTFKNQLVGVDRITYDFSSTTDLEIKLVTPVGDDIVFYQEGSSFMLSYDGAIQTQNHLNNTTIDVYFYDTYVSFEWASYSLTLDIVYPLYNMSVVGNKNEIVIYKDFDSDYDDNFVSGAGSYSLEPTLDANKIQVDAGYFYIGSQEYYMFNRMGVTAVSRLPELVEYIVGTPYFIVRECDIDRAFGYVKTPSNTAYSVEWLVPSGVLSSGMIPSGDFPGDPSGSLPIVSDAMDGYRLVYETSEETRNLIPSGMPPSGVSGITSTLASGLTPSGYHYVPIMNDDAYLVLTDEATSVSNIKQFNLWMDGAKLGESFDFYSYVTDKYGAPMEGVKVIWYAGYESSGSTITFSIGESEETNERGVVSGQITTVRNWGDGFFIWASYFYGGSEVAISKPMYIPIHLSTSLLSINVFQLDNAGIVWDCQPARTAMGYNTFGEKWDSNTTEETGTDIWGDADLDGESDHGDWEDSKSEYKIPPMTTASVVGNLSGEGNYTIFHYCSGYYPGVSGSFDSIYPEMRVSVDGYWGQYLLSGTQLSTITGNCLNSATQYYVSQTADYDAHENFGALGTISTVVGDLATYGNLYYVIYYNGSDYTAATHDDIITDIVAGTKDFYFRGIGIYPILLDDNLDEAWSQSWTISDVLSEGEIQP